jgi:translation elongation factor EF-Ts
MKNENEPKESILKITSGYVVQKFTSNGTFISQSFVEGDEVTYEDEDGNCIEDEDFYHPFDIV